MKNFKFTGGNGSVGAGFGAGAALVCGAGAAGAGAACATAWCAIPIETIPKNVKHEATLEFIKLFKNILPSAVALGAQQF